MYKINIYSALLIIFLLSCSSSNDNVSKFGDESSNSAPELVGLIDFAIDENSTEVTQFTAIDPDNDPIIYSINGIDSSLLTIDENSGLLSFINAPDYENPQDNDQNNIYAVNIIASDGSLSAELGIIIQVNDIDEPSISLTLSSTDISIYNTITLTWTADNADNCTLTFNETLDVDTSGSKTFYFSTPGRNTFTMNCTNDLSSATAEVELVVSEIIIKKIPDKISLFNED